MEGNGQDVRKRLRRIKRFSKLECEGIVFLEKFVLILIPLLFLSAIVAVLDALTSL